MFEVHLSEHDAGVIEARLVGRLDSAASERLDEALVPVLRDPPFQLLLEMSGVSYISSLGIGSIVRARKSLAETGGRVAFIGLQPGVRKVLEIVALLPEESVFASVEEADRYFDAIQQKFRDGGEG